MSTTLSDIKILHEWTVTITREVDETTTEILNGQPVTVTRKVPKPVDVRMALRDLSRKERRAAQRFYDSRVAYYHREHKMLLASELTNRLANTTGGVLTDQQKKRVEHLTERHAALDNDLARLAASNASAAEREAVQRELTTVRTELLNLNALNEQLYASTAEANAQNDQNNWVTFQTILIQRDGKWQPFFEGQGGTDTETFERREESMWALEEAKDPVYEAAVQKIALVTFWFNKGVSTPEGFKLMEEELTKQLEAGKAAKAMADANAVAEQVKVAPEIVTPVAAEPAQVVT